MSNTQNGNALWKELHTRAYYHNGTNDEAFITAFGKKIPRYLTGCPCNEFWNAWIKSHPPVYGKQKYFEWTVATHNAVNAKLGKRQVSLQEAIEKIVH